MLITTKYHLSRITRDEDGRRTFTFTEHSPYEGEAATTYRTDEDGQGLWVLTTSGHNLLNGKYFQDWKQILGTGQFDLTGSDPRGTVARWILADDPEYRLWLDNRENTKAEAKKYLKAYAIA